MKEDIAEKAILEIQKVRGDILQQYVNKRRGKTVAQAIIRECTATIERIANASKIDINHPHKFFERD